MIMMMLKTDKKMLALLKVVGHSRRLKETRERENFGVHDKRRG